MQREKKKCKNRRFKMLSKTNQHSSLKKKIQSFLKLRSSKAIITSNASKIEELKEKDFHRKLGRFNCVQQLYLHVFQSFHTSEYVFYLIEKYIYSIQTLSIYNNLFYWQFFGPIIFQYVIFQKYCLGHAAHLLNTVKYLQSSKA